MNRATPSTPWITEVATLLSVYALGHGQSDGYRNYINCMNDVIGDACDFITSIHNARPTLPVFVMVCTPLLADI